ncbi:hypothetical protein AC249_AIPGENE18309 [Exaiptasia diaphana]|nr:hypothetical protein AC249_AIPGENE18309 [Exaiptasia diaphana]
MEKPMRKRRRIVCPGCNQSYSSRYFIEHKKENHVRGKWLCLSRTGDISEEDKESKAAFDQHVYDYGDSESDDTIVHSSHLPADTNIEEILSHFDDDSHGLNKDKGTTDNNNINLPNETQSSDNDFDDEEQWDEDLEELSKDTEKNEDYTKKQKEYSAGNILLMLTCRFISVWQATCAISDNAVRWLLEFLVALFKILGKNCAFVASLAAAFPSSLQRLWEVLNIDRDNFTKYAVCPKCNSIYSLKEAVVTDISGKLKSLTL